MTGTDPIASVCRLAGIDMPAGWSAYLEIVRHWSARTDLTSARSDDRLAEILFLDAAHLLAGGWCSKQTRLVDVGAGVGAPTIPLLLAERGVSATLVEPRRIRTTFLRAAIGSLGLVGRATVLEHRVDPSRPQVAGAPFDVALSRATFSPSEWLAIGAQLASETWVLTAGAVPEEDSRAVLVRRLDYEVPSSSAPRAVLAYR